MSMTVIVTRNVSDRMRGFLASSMLELNAGVYTSPRMSAGVRSRVWSVIEAWWKYEKEASLVMVWEDSSSTCGQSVKSLGIPPIELVEVDGMVLSKRDIR